jgi:hypothetical protein
MKRGKTMYRAGPVLRLAILVLALVLPAAARADDDDAMDLAFWQSIQNSTVPAEYQAYLDAFPHGKFARLASLRAHQAAPAAAPAANAVAITVGMPGIAPDEMGLVGDGICTTSAEPGPTLDRLAGLHVGDPILVRGIPTIWTSATAADPVILKDCALAE